MPIFKGSLGRLKGEGTYLVGCLGPLKGVGGLF